MNLKRTRLVTSKKTISIVFVGDFIITVFRALCMPVLYTECLAGCFPGHIESTMFCLQVISDITFGSSLTKSEYTTSIMLIQTCYSFQDWWHNCGPLQSATDEHHSILVVINKLRSLEMNACGKCCKKNLCSNYIFDSSSS
jgi:hypothetical protein